jgi:hypothetical protein
MFSSHPNFSQLARVSLRQGGDYGYIDHTGRVVIPFKFGMGGEFQGNLAEVWWQSKRGYIDRTGRLVWKSSEGAEP